MQRRTRPILRHVAVFTLVAVLGVVLPVSQASAGELTDFVIENHSNAPVTLEFTSETCLEPSLAAGFIGATIEVAHGEAFSKQLARRNGHGCDGEDALFSVTPRFRGVRLGAQAFRLSGDGGMQFDPGSIGPPSGHRGSQITSPQPFVWELYLDRPAAPITPAQPPNNPFGKKTMGISLWPATVKLPLIEAPPANLLETRTARLADTTFSDSRQATWVVDAVSPGNFWYISSLHTGLVLTRDGSGNVVVASRVTPEQKSQQWFFTKVAGDTWEIRNRTGGEYLALSGNDVLTGPKAAGGTNWRVETALPYNMPLAKLTIEEVTAVHVSTGQDANTDALFTSIDVLVQVAITAASGGASAGATAARVAARAAGGALTKAGLQAGAKAVTMKVIREGAKEAAKKRVKDLLKSKAKGAAVAVACVASGAAKQCSAAKNEVEDVLADVLTTIETYTTAKGLFNKVYGESPDQLYVNVNNTQVWPNGGMGATDTTSQQTQRIDRSVIFDPAKPLRIELFDYDSGSNDDSIGVVLWSGGSLPVRYEDLIVTNIYEGSTYRVTFKIESLPTPSVPLSALVGQYRAQDVQLLSDLGSISLNGSALTWTDEAGSKIALTPRLDQYKLLLGAGNPFAAIGFTDMTLIMKNNYLIGIHHLGQDYFQVSGKPGSQLGNATGPSAQPASAPTPSTAATTVTSAPTTTAPTTPTTTAKTPPTTTTTATPTAATPTTTSATATPTTTSATATPTTSLTPTTNVSVPTTTTVTGVGAPCAGFTGKFQTDFKEMRLVNGNGVYDWPGQITGTVTQTATGWTLVGRWAQTDGGGGLTFNLDLRGNFTGTWGSGNNVGGGGSWSGRCVVP